MNPVTSGHCCEPLMSLEDVSAYLRVPVWTLRKWRSSGLGPQSFKTGRHVRYRRDTVEAYVLKLERQAG